jgi:hypothetical protein
VRARPLLVTGLVAAAAGGTLGGAPSTLWSVARGDDPTAATRAAGALLGRASLPRGVVAHAGVSVFWGLVWAVLLPRRHSVACGAAAGALVCALDLGVVARRRQALATLADLPWGPQLADHVAFGALAGVVVARRRMAGRPAPARRLGQRRASTSAWTTTKYPSGSFAQRANAPAIAESSVSSLNP